METLNEAWSRVRAIKNGGLPIPKRLSILFTEVILRIARYKVLGSSSGQMAGTT